MQAEFLRQVLEFEDKLKVGSIVIVKFNSGHGAYSARAIVSAKNQQYFKVKLLQEVQFRHSTAKWPVGHIVTVPTYRGRSRILWSQFNRLEPQEGYNVGTESWT